MLKPIQKLRGVALAINYFMRLYKQVKNSNFKKNDFEQEEINQIFKVNEEIIKKWLLSFIGNTLRSIILDK